MAPSHATNPLAGVAGLGVLIPRQRLWDPGPWAGRVEIWGGGRSSWSLTCSSGFHQGS